MFYPIFSWLLATPLFIPTDNRPPTIYSILNMLVNNFDAEKETRIPDLAKAGREKIFDFDYPLTDKIKKEDFEIMILNHYMMRRIGFETVTAFKIQLNVKLNEIMPLYNKMFDALENWNIFDDGEKTTRYGNENKTNKTSNTLTNESTTETNTTSDRRESNTPQNRLEEVQSGEYVTNYNYDTDKSNGSDKSKSKGTANSNEINNYKESVKKSPADKVSILKEIQENIKNIYTLIFNDLDILFYIFP